MTKKLFYKNGPDYFGVNFPLGIDAKELAIKLEVANKKIKTDCLKSQKRLLERND